jgi:hypothetical protein
MVNYTCPRCGFNTDIKTKYTSHLRRKYLCKNIISDDNLYNEYNKYEIKEKISCKSNVSNTSVKSKSNVNKKSDKKLYECNHCNRSYTHRQSLHKHLKSCKEKKKDDEDKQNLLNLVNLLNKQLEEQRYQMNKQLEQLDKKDRQIEEIISKKDKQIDELIKKAGINIGTQNIQQNINILAYKNTDISHLTDNDYLKCLKHSNFCIPHLIEKIHFNPKKPENHNIYISNLKNNYAMVYDGSKWNIKDRDESIQGLIDDKEGIIEQKLEEWIENGNRYPEIMNKFNRYLEKKENNVVINKIKNEIKLLLFNNRDLIS